MNSRRFLPLFIVTVLFTGCAKEQPAAPVSSDFLNDPNVFTTSSDWSPERAPLLFMSGRSGNPEIYRIDPGDTTWVNLTRNEAGDNWPEWSPDGTRIVFHSDRNGKFDIFVMNADGTGLAQLTTHEDHDYVPSWTPDGRIVFTSWRQEPADTSRASHVYTMDADGSNQQRLGLADGAPVSGARFGPDGRTIVYGRENGDGTADLYLASTDDLVGHKITPGGAYFGDPAFSPDGKWVAYYSDGQNGSDLLVQDIASAAVDTALSGGGNWYPRFSPDGRWMLSCTETSHGNYDVLYFPLDGTAPAHPLVASPRRDCEARWSPLTAPAPATP